MSKTVRVLSLGAGVQSSALALMIAAGEVPMVDCAIFADTQSEPQEVYDWLDWLESQLPFPVYRVTAGNLMEDSLKLKESEKHPGNWYLKTIVPMFVAMARKIGMLPRRCTRDYKIVPIQRKLRELVGGDKVIWKWRAKNLLKKQAPLVEQLIGISRDEWGRMKSSRQPWIANQYPLVDLFVTRGDCHDWMRVNNYPQAPRSACIICPLRSNEEWAKLDRTEIERAAEWENRIQQQQQQQQECAKRQKGPMFIHRSCQPLNSIDFSTPGIQLSLFDLECEGMCGL